MPADANVQDIMDHLDTPPDLEILLALDGVMVDADTALHDGATLALIPAVAGGTGINFE
jgi:molybdopterin converting factor small subunit